MPRSAASTWPWPAATWACSRRKWARRKTPPHRWAAPLPCKSSSFPPPPTIPSGSATWPWRSTFSGALDAQRQPAKSVESYQRAAALQKKVVDLRPDDSDAQRELALT